jgi:hypothetical protein
VLRNSAGARRCVFWCAEWPAGRHGAEIDLAADQQTKPLAGCNALGLVCTRKINSRNGGNKTRMARGESRALTLQLKTQKCCVLFSIPHTIHFAIAVARGCVFVGKVRGAARTTRCNVLFTVHEWATVIKDNLLYCSKLCRPARAERERKRLRLRSGALVARVVRRRSKMAGCP